MDSEETGILEVSEWTVGNFSSWNCEIHGVKITSQQIGATYFHLYPRGISGKDNRLVVHLRRTSRRRPSGKLYYYGPDGDILCIEDVDKHYASIPPGPKFQELIDQIRRGSGDNITLEFQVRRQLSGGCDWRPQTTASFYSGRTVLQVSAAFVRIPCDVFQLPATRASTTIEYQRDEGSANSMLLTVAKSPVAPEIELSLKPTEFADAVLVTTTLSVSDVKGTVVKSEDCEHVFRDGSGWTFSKVTELGGCLLLKMEIVPKNKFLHEFYDPIPTKGAAVVSCFEFTYDDSPATSLAKELRNLFEDRDFSDFRIRCGEVVYPTHRAILSARSPVLKRMLSSDMKEAESGEMDIADMEPSILASFLAFLYTGTVGEDHLTGDRALKLYLAADKYQVPTLKRRCASVIAGEVTISNVCDILSLAHRHQDDKLSAVARYFILKNYV